MQIKLTSAAIMAILASTALAAPTAPIVAYGRYTDDVKATDVSKRSPPVEAYGRYTDDVKRSPPVEAYGRHTDDVYPAAAVGELPCLLPLVFIVSLRSPNAIFHLAYGRYTDDVKSGTVEKRVPIKDDAAVGK